MYLILWIISLLTLLAGFTLGYFLNPQWYRLLWIGFGLVPFGLAILPIVEWVIAREELLDLVRGEPHLHAVMLGVRLAVHQQASWRVVNPEKGDNFTPIEGGFTLDRRCDRPGFVVLSPEIRHRLGRFYSVVHLA